MISATVINVGNKTSWLSANVASSWFETGDYKLHAIKYELPSKWKSEAEINKSIKYENKKFYR